MCLFCDNEDYKDKLTAAGEYHSGSNNPNTRHVEPLTENWKQMAIQLGEVDVHTKLCCGDVRASEMYYHKATCYMQFRNRYKSLQQQEKNASTERETILLECYTWKQISNMIYDSSELFIDVSNLEIKYSELMKSHNIIYSPHMTRLLGKLKHQVPGLNDQKIGKKLYVSLRTKYDKEVEECLQPQTLIDMMQKVSKEVKTKLRDTVTDFTGSFSNDLSFIVF